MAACAYAATVLVIVVGLSLLYVSYSNNRAYLDQVANDVATLRRVRPPAARSSLEAFTPYLNAVRAVSDSANRYRDGAPWSMRAGLYQGNVMGNAARDAYKRELDSIVLPRFAARVRQRLIDYGGSPEKLYVYLKAYLMLGEPRRLDKKHLQFVADIEWPPPTSGVASGALPSTHFRNLLESSDTLRPVAIEPTLVAQARGTIRQASIPQIIYGQLQRSYADDPNALRLDTLSVGVEKVLRRRSGRRLSDPIPALYTQKVFKEVTGPGMLPFVKQFAEEEWVWGTGGVAGGAAAFGRLGSQVSEIYERDYANAWDAFLNDLEIVPFTSVQQVLRRARDHHGAELAAENGAEDRCRQYVAGRPQARRSGAVGYVTPQRRRPRSVQQGPAGGHRRRARRRSRDAAVRAAAAPRLRNARAAGHGHRSSEEDSRAGVARRDRAGRILTAQRDYRSDGS